MKTKDMTSIETSIEDFCDLFGTTVVITNAKGLWMARVTRKAVQILVATGDSLLEVQVNLAEKCNKKRKELGK